MLISSYTFLFHISHELYWLPTSATQQVKRSNLFETFCTFYSARLGSLRFGDVREVRHKTPLRQFLFGWESSQSISGPTWLWIPWGAGTVFCPLLCTRQLSGAGPLVSTPVERKSPCSFPGVWALHPAPSQVLHISISKSSIPLYVVSWANTHGFLLSSHLSFTPHTQSILKDYVLYKVYPEFSSFLTFTVWCQPPPLSHLDFINSPLSSYLQGTFLSLCILGPTV